jgi:nitrous oxidase accessory protein
MKIFVIKFFFIFLLSITYSPSYSKTWPVYPGESISDTIKFSEHGDTIVINKGVYNQRFIIDKSLSVIGKDFPVIDGGGKGSVIKVTAPNTVIKGLKIRGTGSSLSVEDTGIDLENAPNSVLENNILEDVLFGIYIKNSPGTLILNNNIYGKNLPLPERGDGIRLWYSSES